MMLVPFPLELCRYRSVFVVKKTMNGQKKRKYAIQNALI